MKWRARKGDHKKALDLSPQQVTRLDGAVIKAWNICPPAPDGTISMDELMEIIAPYIQSQEEAFYIALEVSTRVMVAQSAANRFKRN